MAENLYRRATKEEREAAWAESRLFYEIQEATNQEVAREEGLAAGAAQREREIAKNLKRSGIPFDVIAKNTGLTLKEVEEL